MWALPGPGLEPVSPALAGGFFFFLNKFIYLFIFGCIGLCCCTQAFSSCGERGLFFVAVCGLLIAVASLVEEHGL